MVSLVSSSENFIFQACEAFRKAVERASGVTLEGREREFRRVLARYLFDELLGWEERSKVGEIYDIACFDDENFPLIIVETKWGVELTHEIKEKLRRRIEELGSVRYGVFASEREFIVYIYEDYELREITKVNVAEAVGVARREFGLSKVAKMRTLKLELLKRERLVWIEDPEYFEKTYKEVSLAKEEGVKLLTENLKDIVGDVTTVLTNVFNSYLKRKDHYSGRFLGNTFNDWLKISMKAEEFKRDDETKKGNLIEVFCRETAYVLLGRVLFTRMCEDKDIIETMISGKGIAEALKYYGKRGIENAYLRLSNESRKEIKKYYSHLHELGFFDWWVIEEVKKGTLIYDDRKIQDNLEKDLDYSIKKALRRLNRFDFTQVNRDILGDVYQGYLPTEERKLLGEFYTPTEVVEYILDAVGYKAENEIRGKKILDPACGSGSFLVEATQRLIKRYRRIGFNLENPDDAKQIIDGCINYIYGLDIHPFACFIAEMNLLFQLVDLYDVVKKKDKYFELPRLNVYRTDSLTLPGKPIELTEFFDNSRRKVLIEETKGADKVKGIKFDYVVGNPPYVRQESISNKELLEKVYSEVFDGRADYCVYFITKGVTWLKEKGKFGYIVSGKFTKSRYGRYLRAYLLGKTRILQLVDLRGSKVFREATNDPIILILQKEKKAYGTFNVAQLIADMGGETNEERTKRMIAHIRRYVGKEHRDDYIWCFKSSQTELAKGIRKEMAKRRNPMTSKEWCIEWVLLPSEYLSLIKKIKQDTKLLEEICDVYYGIRPGLNEAFVVDEDTITEFGLERELLKPLLRGKDLQRYRINYRGLHIVYTVADTNLEEYPNIKAHLSSFRQQLEKRKQYTQRKKRGEAIRWYEVEQPVSPYIFRSKKILVPDISERNNFVYDDEKYYCLDTCFIIVPKTEYAKYLVCLLGLLNSTTLEFYFKQIAAYLGKKGYRYKKQYLDRLPFKLPQTGWEKRIADQITKNVNRILQIKEQSNLSEDRLGTFPYSYFENGWSFNKLKDIAKVHLSKSSYKISKETLRTYSFRELEHPFKEVFRIILTTEEHIDFYSEEVASYVLEVLRNSNSVTKRQLLELKIPFREHLKNLMDQHRRDKEQIIKNEKATEDLEKQINDLVYKLYDISYDQRRIIEDYLKKF